MKAPDKYRKIWGYLLQSNDRKTLAKVYLEQKKYNKAIQAYEILILKYPEKVVSLQTDK